MEFEPRWALAPRYLGRQAPYSGSVYLSVARRVGVPQPNRVDGAPNTSPPTITKSNLTKDL